MCAPFHVCPQCMLCCPPDTLRKKLVREFMLHFLLPTGVLVADCPHHFPCSVNVREIIGLAADRGRDWNPYTSAQ